MDLLEVIPTIFYEDINTGVKFFTIGLGFEVTFMQDNLCIIKRGSTTLHLVEDAELARGNRPEMRISTDDIESYYEEIVTSHPEMLHPELNRITEQPWGLKEFALLDESLACIIVQQPVAEGETETT